jgi:hypothetical protein
MNKSKTHAEDQIAITRLMYEYAYRLDSGDFEGFADLFRYGVWNGTSGYQDVLDWLRRWIVLYDGETLSHHAVSNVIVDVAENGTDAAARCYITISQLIPADGAVRILTANTYANTFAKHDGLWTFRECTIPRRLTGDISTHRSGPPNWKTTGV